MAMMNVKVSTTTTRKTVQVDSSESLAAAFDKAGIPTSGDLSFTLNGRSVKSNDLNTTFDSHSVNLNETAILSAVVNSKNA